MDYSNYENETFDTLPATVTGCNFINCHFVNAEGTTFAKCNIDECVFDTIAAFSLCNVYYTDATELPEGCTLDRTNVVKKDVEETDTVEE